MTEYTLRLTERELWYLSGDFEASFTDPSSKNEHEIRVTEKLEKLLARAYRDRTKDRQ